MQLCVLGNLCPETVEEAIAMVPSIKVIPIIFRFYNLSGIEIFYKFGVVNSIQLVISYYCLPLWFKIIKGKENMSTWSSTIISILVAYCLIVFTCRLEDGITMMMQLRKCWMTCRWSRNLNKYYSKHPHKIWRWCVL